MIRKRIVVAIATMLSAVGTFGISNAALAAPPTVYTVNWLSMQPGQTNVAPVEFTITPSDVRSQRFRIDSTYSSLIPAAEQTSGTVNVSGGKCKNVTITTSASLVGATCHITNSFIVLTLASASTAQVAFSFPVGSITASPTSSDVLEWGTSYTTNGGSSWITADSVNAAFDNLPGRTLTPSNQTVTGVVGTSLSSTALSPVNMYGPFSFSISPALPSGLTLNTSSGVISGTPQASQSGTSYTITVSSASAGTATNTLTLSVNAAAPQPATPESALPKTGLSTGESTALFAAALSLLLSGVILLRKSQIRSRIV